MIKKRVYNKQAFLYLKLILILKKNLVGDYENFLQTVLQRPLVTEILNTGKEVEY